MFASWIIILQFLADLISAHGPKLDPSCFELKTPLRADDCCVLPDVFEDSVIEKCVNETLLVSDENENMKCIAECVAKAVGVFKNGVVDKDATSKFLANTLGKDPNFGPIVGASFDRCYARLKAIPDHKTTSRCSCGPDFILSCLESDWFQNCPAKIWKESDGCKELKGKLAKGCPYMAIVDDLD